jgi:hypothetical protein
VDGLGTEHHCSHPAPSPWHRRRRSRGSARFPLFLSFVIFLGALSFLGVAWAEGKGVLLSVQMHWTLKTFRTQPV